MGTCPRRRTGNVIRKSPSTSACKLVKFVHELRWRKHSGVSSAILQQAGIEKSYRVDVLPRPVCSCRVVKPHALVMLSGRVTLCACRGSAIVATNIIGRSVPPIYLQLPFPISVRQGSMRTKLAPCGAEHTRCNSHGGQRCLTENCGHFLVRETNSEQSRAKETERADVEVPPRTAHILLYVRASGDSPGSWP